MGFWQGFVLITTVHLLAAAAPGPDFVMVTQQTLLHGKRAGWWCSLGIALGLGVHMAYSIFGLAATIAHSQPLLQAIRLAGGGYLLFLGWQSLRASWPHAPKAKGLTSGAAAEAASAADAAASPADASSDAPINPQPGTPTALAACAAAAPQAVTSSRADAASFGAAAPNNATTAPKAMRNTTPSARSSLLKGFFCNVLNPKAPLYFVSLFTVLLSPDLPLAQLLLYGLWMMALQLAWFSAVALLLSQPRLQAAFMRGRHWVDRACGLALGLLGLRVLALLR